jgi:ribonuclease BN (tRNA processing enzyme)
MTWGKGLRMAQNEGLAMTMGVKTAMRRSLSGFPDIIRAVEDLPDTITFLGTAGARFVVTKQFLASGGAWLNFGGTEILLDPGPGCLVQSVKRKLDASRLKAIILSHKHLDHSGDINIMIEAMTEGGWKQRGVVFAPSDALDKDAVILPYLQNYPQEIDILSEGKSYSIEDISFETPVKHRHPVETYGFVFRTPRHTFSWITDTKYFGALSRYYRAELLIMNVVMLEPRDGADHLSIPDARQIIGEVKPKTAILTHFGMSLWRAKPWELAQKLSEDTGIKVIAARDGMRFDLARLEEL